jgi:phage terminase Nu1 subunit (DNA packaging protein)
MTVLNIEDALNFHKKRKFNRLSEEDIDMTERNLPSIDRKQYNNSG